MNKIKSQNGVDLDTCRGGVLLEYPLVYGSINLEFRDLMTGKPWFSLLAPARKPPFFNGKILSEYVTLGKWAERRKICLATENRGPDYL